VHSQSSVPAGSVPPSLSEGKEKLSSGNWRDAVGLLENAAQVSPTNAEAQFYLGKAYGKAKSYDRAKVALRTAMRLSPASALAEQANQELLSLPRKVIAPRAKRPVARIRGRRIAPAAVMKPKIINFYASWAQPCKLLQPVIEKAKNQYGDQVEFLSVDVDDPKNDHLIQEFDVSPIPTIVFLDGEGQMVTFTIGFSGDAAIESGIKKVLHKV